MQEDFKMPEVSIIVPVWNHCEDLTKPFMEALLEKTEYKEYEVLIVNNGSTDDTKVYLQKLKKKYPQVKVVNLDKNYGFGGGNNKGYEQATGKYICFISNDVMVENSSWLTKLVAEATANPNAVLGDLLITWNDLTNFRGKPTNYLAGYLVFGEKTIFDAIKEDNQVFDEEFGVAYFEDVFLSAVAVSKGYQLQAIKGLGVNHLGSKTSVNQIDITKQTQIAKRHFTNRMQILYLETSKKKRIVFYFKSSYPFLDFDYEGKGVGGAESALILLARQFAKNGWQTEIYNTTQVTGTFNGVEYHHVSELVPTDFCDVFVCFREPYAYLNNVNAITKIFWSCDQYTVGNWKSEVFPYVDKVIAISEYHGAYVEMRYGPIKDKLQVIELGVNKEDYEEKLEKISGKMIYCSVPGRGLDQLARLWPAIKEQVPHAHLVITSDYRLWGTATPMNDEYRRLFGMRSDVQFFGKVTREELVYHQKTAELMVYPCTYEECFCIASMECIAAGAIPVTTKLAALKTTVADSGILLSNLPGKGNYDSEFVANIVALLTDKGRAESLRNNGYERAMNNYTYESVVFNWALMIKDTETKGGEKSMAKPVCETCGRAMPNAYVLNQHMAKHTKQGELSPIANVPVEGGVPTMQILRFNVPVEFIINGKKYEGTEIEIESDRVSGALDNVSRAYGPEAIAA